MSDSRCQGSNARFLNSRVVVEERTRPLNDFLWFEGVSERYGDGAGNTVEENSSVFYLIRMR